MANKGIATNGNIVIEAKMKKPKSKVLMNPFTERLGI